MKFAEFVKKCGLEGSVSAVLIEIGNLGLLKNLLTDEKFEQFQETIKNLICKTIRKHDHVDILEEGKFLVLLADLSKEDSPPVVDRITKEIESVEFEGNKIPLEVFAASVTYPDDGTDETQLMEKAENALENAKTSGARGAVSIGEGGIKIGEVFIGRTKELRQLSDLLSEARNGGFYICFIRGKMGIGKTALLNRFAQILTCSDAKVLRGKSLYYEEPIPYQLFYNIFSNPVSGKIEGQLVDRLKEIKTLFYSEKLPEAAKEKLFFSTARLLEDLSQDTPVVILADDLHWIDLQSSDLLKFLAVSNLPMKVLFVGAYSEDLVEENLEKLISTLADSAKFISLKLSEFNEVELMLYVMQSYGVVQVDSKLSDYLLYTTEGVPLFLKETLTEMADHGLLVKTGDRLSMKAPLNELSENLKNYIVKRFNFWDPDTRKLLQTASVFGEEFPFQILRDILKELSPEALLKALDKAIVAEVVKKINGKSDTYRFSPRILWQALLSTLTPSRRRTLHIGILMAMERAHMNRTLKDILSLAYHAKHAGDPTKAALYLERASSIALKEQKYRETYEYLKEALKLVEKEKDLDPEIRWEILDKASEAALFIDPELSIRSMEMALSEFPNREKRAKALMILGEVKTLLGEDVKAEEHLQEALSLMDALRNVPGMLRCYRGLGNYYLSMGDRPKDAERNFFKAIALITEGLALDMEMPEAEKELSRIYGSLGNYYFVARGNLKKARFYFEKELNIAEGLKDRLEIANSYLHLGRLHRSEGDWNTALFHFEKALEIYKDFDFYIKTATVNAEIGLLHRIGGDFSKSKDFYTVAVKELEKAGVIKNLKVEILLGLSIANLRIGEFKASFDALEEAKGILSASQNPILRAKLLATEGEIYLSLGIKDKAKELLTNAYDMARSLSDKFLGMTCGILYSQAIMDSSPEEAYEILNSLIEAYSDFDRALLLWARISRGKTLVLQGKPDEALKLEDEVGEQITYFPGFEHLHEYYIVLGTARYYRSEFPRALELFREALKEAEKSNNPLAQLEAHNWIYRTLNKLGIDDEARLSLERAENIINTIKNSLPFKGREKGAFLDLKEL